jgi:hypothetical protein
MIALQQHEHENAAGSEYAPEEEAMDGSLQKVGKPFAKAGHDVAKRHLVDGGRGAPLCHSIVFGQVCLPQIPPSADWQ